MAIDQAILEQLRVQDGPTLRFYTWQRPTLSLGYFQRHGDAETYIAGQSSQADVAQVRRGTGGGAIIHHHELTYSLAIPHDSSRGPSTGARPDIYQQLHQIIVTALAEFGVAGTPFRELAAARVRPATEAAEPFLCFQRRTDEDVIVSGYKILGSAQRRGRLGLLQHGSILLSTSPFAPALPGIAELTLQRIAPETLADVIRRLFCERYRVQLEPRTLTRQETDAAERIVAERFTQDAWWQRR